MKTNKSQTILQNIKTHFLSVIKSSRIEFYDYYERNTYVYHTYMCVLWTNFITTNSENHKELLTKSQRKWKKKQKKKMKIKIEEKDGMDFMLQEHITLSYITF